MIETLINTGRQVLNDFQLNILEECLKKGSGGLSILMGSGKTIISIVLMLELLKKSMTNSGNRELGIVVVSKSLLPSWEFEIEKFFKKNLPYQIFHQKTEKFILNPNTLFILTTPKTLVKYYKLNEIDKKFIYELEVNNFVKKTCYRIHNEPYLTSNNQIDSFIYSTRWSCLIVDEAHVYTNIKTLNTQSIGSLCCENRWLLSGTLFSEPKLERILGYYVLLNHKTFPRNIPDTKLYVYSQHFRGVSQELVHREKNEMYIEPEVNKIIIEHYFNDEEQKVYTMMKNVMNRIRDKVKEFILNDDTKNTRKFSAYLLAIISYLRQCLICPMLPIANIAADCSDFTNKHELSKIIKNELDFLNLNEWMNDEKNIKSSRINKVLESINNHPNEQIVIFSCFRTSIDILIHFIKNELNRNCYTLSADMSTKKRSEILKKFTESKNDIFLLSYDLGAEGLNLQSASNVIILDLWWNTSKTKQAIARVVRFGQKAKSVNVYMYSSNTGIEKALLDKHKSKTDMINELKTGPLKSKIPKMRMDDIIQFINLDDNSKLLKELN